MRPSFGQVADQLSAALRSPGASGVPVEHPHHALDDAPTTAQIFLVLLPELENLGIGTPRRLLRVSRS